MKAEQRKAIAMLSILLNECDGRLVINDVVIKEDADGIPVMEEEGEVTYLDEVDANTLNSLIIAWRTEHSQEFNNIINA